MAQGYEKDIAMKVRMNISTERFKFFKYFNKNFLIIQTKNNVLVISVIIIITTIK